jgi:hypothetical protein
MGCLPASDIINVAREEAGDECTHEKLKPSITGTQSRRTVLLESNRRNQTSLENDP